MLATFWSTMPLTGWTRFSLGKVIDLRLIAKYLMLLFNHKIEKTLVSCVLEWMDQSFSVKSYNFCLFMFNYLGPTCLIFIFNIRLICMVSSKNLFYALDPKNP